MSQTGRIVRNTLANWTGNLCNLLVLLFITPFLLGHLGDERFGIYAVAQQALRYLSLLTLNMRPAANRFIARDIALGNVGRLNTIVSTMSVFYLAVGVVGLVTCGALGLWAPAFFNIDPIYSNETTILFAALGVIFLLSLIAFNYQGVLAGHQRFDLLNGGEILREMSRAGLIVLAFSIGWNSLAGLGSALLAAFVLALVYFSYISHRCQPGLRIRPRLAERTVAREVIGFGLWNGVIQFGNVMAFATPTLVVAKILGPAQVVFYAVPFMIAERLRIVVAGMASSLAPIAATTLVTGDRDQFRRLIINGTRAAAAICFPIGGIMLVLSEPFLGLWMGPDYAWSWRVYGVLMIAMFGRISQAPTLHVLVGGGRIRGLAYIQSCSAVATIVLTIVLGLTTSLGVVGVATGVAIPLFLSHSIGVPWYASRQMGVPLLKYYREAYVWPAFSALLGVGCAALLTRILPPADWVALVIDFCLSLGVSGVAVWFKCLDPAVRRQALQKMGIRRAKATEDECPAEVAEPLEDAPGT